MARRTAFTIPATTSIVNKYSSGGVSNLGISNDLLGVEVTSGVGASGVLGTALSVSGAGYMPYLICYSKSATPAHTIRCQVIVDGVIAFDATSDTITTTLNRGMTIVDSVPQATTNSIASGVPIRFNSSLVVNFASSQSGTNYVAIRYEYQKTAS